ncbi:glyoxylate reductase/hydroxypyruvate reductase isoform X2 [Aethina tumida]|nr:glyoxylate reductase/hydroxypyruvate reductase isoform X2 [Aethina tumida]XP_049818298.1 glyoxylate reductase/hydroxypyruvate reductase isoform X2 [Aethina tumida]
MSRPKILMSNPTTPQIAFDILSQKCELIRVEHETKDEILSKVPGVDALFWATKIPLDKDIIEAAGPQMKTVGTMSAGVNHIDLAELKKRGIRLGNTPEVLNDAVADIAVLLALAASRRLHEGFLKIQQGQWKPNQQWMLGQDISGSTVGIIGLGGIGQTILKRLRPFGVSKFLYTGHKEKPEGTQLGAHFVDLDSLANESDFIIVACPLTDETRGILGRDFFSKTKSNAVFVNIARGEIVDQDALVNALKTGKIFAAGLDVMTPEPLPTDSELLTLPNVVLLPHLGSATKKTRDAMAELTANNILRGLGGEEMFTPVF